MRLLLVEDDDRVAAAQQLVLGRHGIHVTRAPTATRAMEVLGPAPDAFDVIVLDLGLPDGDGLTLCRDMRRATSTPVIISSARGDVGTRLQGLHTGADDYLVKPYDLRELVAKVHVLVRRRSLDTTRGQGPGAGPEAPAPTAPVEQDQRRERGERGEEVLRIGPVVIDLARRTLHVNGVLVPLTTKEFDLVALLARAPGVVFTREQIMAEVWGVRTGGTDHTLDVHVARIRSKARLPGLIGTVRGVGLRLSIGN